MHVSFWFVLRLIVLAHFGPAVYYGDRVWGNPRVRGWAAAMLPEKPVISRRCLRSAAIALIQHKIRRKRAGCKPSEGGSSPFSLSV
jgi:hypothetical protein